MCSPTEGKASRLYTPQRRYFLSRMLNTIVINVNIYLFIIQLIFTLLRYLGYTGKQHRSTLL